MMRRSLILVAFIAAFALASFPPASGESFAVVEHGECVDMKIRLEPALDGAGNPIPHQYRLRELAAQNCWRSHVSEASQTFEGGSAAFTTATVFSDGEEGSDCSGAECWPEMCAGVLSGALEVELWGDDSGKATVYSVHKGGAVVRHLNPSPGGAGPSVLLVRGHELNGGVVAVAGRFTRTDGGCDQTFAEFEGEMVFFDPPPPNPDHL